MGDRANGILLDSSVVIAHLRGRLDVFSLRQPGEELYLSLIALGELYKGIEKSGRAEHHQELVDSFAEQVSLLYPDIETAVSYARTAVALEKLGRPLPENDVWIAAVALEYDMALATRDAHFNHVQSLTVLPW